MEFIEDFLRKQKDNDLLRILRPIEQRGRGRVVYKGVEYWDFYSNDYLGLSTHPALLEASIKALNDWGTGSTASRLLSGSLKIHHDLENAIAAFKGKEAALVFNSGFQANIGFIPALCRKGDIVFSDKLNHASIVDALRLAEAESIRYRHNDTDHLRQLLQQKRAAYRNAWIITDTVFSMDGDICSLTDLIKLKKENDCALIVDEAHATGIFGINGSGIVERDDYVDDVDIIMGTFSKALGSFGAYVAADRAVIDYLINCARSFIYSTALPPTVIGANIAALTILKKEPDRRAIVIEKASFFRSQLKSLGLNVIGNSQIVPWIVGDNRRTMDICRMLRERGYWVLPIREPTVPHGQERLRFTITYDHPQEMLEQLVHDIAEIA